jgi:hypothetical protein
MLHKARFISNQIGTGSMHNRNQQAITVEDAKIAAGELIPKYVNPGIYAS